MLDASDPEARISYYRWYSNTEGNNPESDVFVVEVSDDGGQSWVNLETVGPAGAEVGGGWFRKQFRIADVPGMTNTSQLRIRFHASDLGGPSVVEAGVDGVEVGTLGCDKGGIPGDFDGDEDVDASDLLVLLAAWGECPDPECPADLDGDGDVDAADLLILLANWG